MNSVSPITDLKLPPVLYKFRDYKDDYHLKSLWSEELYIPSVNEFNDPSDSTTPFRYKEEDLTEDNIYRKCLQIAKLNYPDKKEEEHQQMAFENQRKGLLFDEDHTDKFDRMNYEQTCRDFGVYCLTPKFENFLVWSYYANSHKGFCLGYHTAILVNTEIFSIGGLVDYRKDYPKLPLFPTEQDHLFLNIFYTKWDIWKHEKEYRLIHQYKTGKLQKIPKNAIAELILGCNFPETEKLGFTEKFIKQFPEAKVFQMELVKGKFGLVKKLIYDEKLLLNILN
jgi:hypothetical protein